MFEPTLVGSFSRMVNFLRISWSILSPSVVNFYAHLVNSRCRLHQPLLNQKNRRGGWLKVMIFDKMSSTRILLSEWFLDELILA
ncbi:MAG: hypothetical protein LIR22_06020, partial [Bacillota bacterium]|nr:hypothetical protein [Bacillota bacterium]